MPQEKFHRAAYGLSKGGLKKLLLAINIARLELALDALEEFKPRCKLEKTRSAYIDRIVPDLVAKRLNGTELGDNILFSECALREIVADLLNRNDQRLMGVEGKTSTSVKNQLNMKIELAKSLIVEALNAIPYDSFEHETAEYLQDRELLL